MPILFSPSPRSRPPRNLAALFRAELRCPRFPALQPAASAERHGSGIFGGIVRARIGLILSDARGDIDDQLCELVGIAGTGFS